MLKWVSLRKSEVFIRMFLNSGFPTLHHKTGRQYLPVYLNYKEIKD